MPRIPTLDARASHARIPADELRVRAVTYALVRNAEGRYQLATSAGDGVAPASFVVNGEGRVQVTEPVDVAAVPIVRIGPAGPFIL